MAGFIAFVLMMLAQDPGAFNRKALILRGAMIAVGAQRIHEFHWILYVFAVFLSGTAFKMLCMKTDYTDPEHNAVVRLTRRLFLITSRFHGEHFVVRAGNAHPDALIFARPGRAPANAARGPAAAVQIAYRAGSALRQAPMWRRSKELRGAARSRSCWCRRPAAVHD